MLCIGQKCILLAFESKFQRFTCFNNEVSLFSDINRFSVNSEAGDASRVPVEAFS